MPSDKPDDANRIADDALARYAIGRLVRSSNLAIFLVIGTALVCLAYVKTSGLYLNRKESGGWLVWLRVLLPLLALFLTGVITRQVLARFIARVGDVDLSLADYLPAFSQCKLISIVLLTVVGFFSSACLLLSHKVMDALLAGLPVLLLLISRPTFFSLMGFAGTVQTMRDDAAKRSTTNGN